MPPPCFIRDLSDFQDTIDINEFEAFIREQPVDPDPKDLAFRFYGKAYMNLHILVLSAYGAERCVDWIEKISRRGCRSILQDVLDDLDPNKRYIYLPRLFQSTLYNNLQFYSIWCLSAGCGNPIRTIPNAYSCDDDDSIVTYVKHDDSIVTYVKPKISVRQRHYAITNFRKKSTRQDFRGIPMCFVCRASINTILLDDLSLPEDIASLILDVFVRRGKQMSSTSSDVESGSAPTE